jgi:hypothetical protein
MVQLETMISGLPLASVPYIREVIKGVSLEQVSPPDLPEEVIAQKVSRGPALAKLSKEHLFDLFKDRVFSLSDLKKQTIDDRKMIRLQFPLDIDFINFLKQKRELNKKAG